MSGQPIAYTAVVFDEVKKIWEELGDGTMDSAEGWVKFCGKIGSPCMGVRSVWSREGLLNPGKAMLKHFAALNLGDKAIKKEADRES